MCLRWCSGRVGKGRMLFLSICIQSHVLLAIALDDFGSKGADGMLLLLRRRLMFMLRLTLSFTPHVTRVIFACSVWRGPQSSFETTTTLHTSHSIFIARAMGIRQLPDEVLLLLLEQWPARELQLRQLSAVLPVWYFNRCSLHVKTNGSIHRAMDRVPPL